MTIILNPPAAAPPIYPPDAPADPLTTTAQRLYARWEPYWLEDAANGYPLWYLALALCENSQKVDEIARDTDTHEAFHVLFDPQAAPVWTLAWLAQLVRVTLLPADSEQQQRDRIASASGFYAGTQRAIREEVAAVLTGTKTVRIVKGSAWTLSVITRTSETPDPAEAERRARLQKPVGVVLTFIVSDDPVWLEAGDAVLWDDVDPGVIWDDVTLPDIT